MPLAEVLEFLLTKEIEKYFPDEKREPIALLFSILQAQCDDEDHRVKDGAF